MANNIIIHQRKHITVNQAVANLLGLNLPPTLVFDDQGRIIGVDEGDYSLEDFLARANYDNFEKARHYFLKVHDAIDRKLLNTAENGKITLYSFLKWAKREQLLPNRASHNYTLKDVCELLIRLAATTKDVDVTISEVAKNYQKLPSPGTKSKKGRRINNGQSADSIQKRIVNAKNFMAGENTKILGLPGFFTTLAFLIELNGVAEPDEIVNIAMKIKHDKINDSERKKLINRWLDGEKTEVF